MIARKSFLCLSGTIIGVFLFGITTVFAGTTPSISSVTYKEGCNKILVTFNESVFNAVTGSGALAAADFTFNDAGSDGMTTISSVAHTAGNSWAVLTMNANAVAGDAGETLNATANNIFTLGGALGTKTVTLAADFTLPAFQVRYKAGVDKLLVDFDKLVWTIDQCTAAFDDAANVLVNTDFNYIDNGLDNATALGTAAQHMPNNRDQVVLDLNAILNQTGDIDDTESINVASGAAVYDVFGNAVASSAKDFGAANTTSDSTVPTISSVEAVKDKIYLLVNFSEPISSADPTNAPLTVLTINDEADLDYTDTGGSRAIVAADLAAVAGNNFVVLKLDSAIAVADLNADTLAATGTVNIYDTFGNAMTAIAVNINDTTDPVLLSAALDNTGNKNTIAFTYSEDVTITGSPAANASQASTTALGDLTAAGNFVGFGTFASVGNVTYTTLANTVALNSAGTIYTITLAGQAYSSTLTPIKTAGTTDPSGVFTPQADEGGSGIEIADLAPTPNRIESTSVVTSTPAGAGWDLAIIATPTPLSGFTPNSAMTTSVNIGWTALSPDPADLDTYIVYYRTTTGVNFGNGTAWHKINDSTLSTITTATTQVTGLNSGTIYYFTIYVVDLEGNLNVAATEINIQTNAFSANVDRTAPSTPTNVQVESKDGKAVLTWTNPTNSDLADIVILRGKNGFPVSGTFYAVVNKGIETYVDSDVVPGDIVKYILRARDASRNESANSIEVSVTIVAPEERSPFSDVPKDHWAATVIQHYFNIGVVHGYSDGIFGPGNPATRAEALKILMLANKIEVDKKITIAPFPDVPVSEWYAPYIAKAKERGLVQGRRGGIFAPETEINRAEMLTLILRTAGVDVKNFVANGTVSFQDVQASDWYYKHVIYAAEKDIVKGYKDNTFQAGKSANRAEILQMLSAFQGVVK